MPAIHRAALTSVGCVSMNFAMCRYIRNSCRYTLAGCICSCTCSALILGTLMLTAACWRA